MVLSVVECGCALFVVVVRVYLPVFVVVGRCLLFVFCCLVVVWWWFGGGLVVWWWFDGGLVESLRHGESRWEGGEG